MSALHHNMSLLHCNGLQHISRPRPVRRALNMACTGTGKGPSAARARGERQRDIAVGASGVRTCLILVVWLLAGHRCGRHSSAPWRLGTGRGVASDASRVGQERKECHSER